MPSATSQKLSPGQNLLIDADDTLWENNIYFERAITDFISFLNHRHYTPDEVRHALFREVVGRASYAAITRDNQGHRLQDRRTSNGVPARRPRNTSRPLAAPPLV